MRKREFMVDLKIYLPTDSNDIDEWHYVGHLIEGLVEGSLAKDSLDLSAEIVEQIHEWRLENPDDHNCYDHAEEVKTEVWACTECDKDVTADRNEQMVDLAMQERKFKGV